MPERRLFPEFRDQFRETRYPFDDTSSLVSERTQQRLGFDIFADACLYPVGVTGAIHLAAVAITGRTVTLTVANTTRTTLATTTFETDGGDEVLKLTDTAGRPAGVLVAAPGQLTQFSTWATGTHTFQPTATRFAPSCVIVTPGVGVRGLVTEEGDVFTQDTLIVGDNGVVVREGGTLNSIRVDIVGDPLFRRKLCTPLELFKTPNFIRTINGCPPDAAGNFNLTVGDHENPQTVVRVYRDTEGLVIAAVGVNSQRV